MTKAGSLEGVKDNLEGVRDCDPHDRGLDPTGGSDRCLYGETVLAEELEELRAGRAGHG
jgi:hypothetical protein